MNEKSFELFNLKDRSIQQSVRSVTPEDIKSIDKTEFSQFGSAQLRTPSTKDTDLLESPKHLGFRLGSLADTYSIGRQLGNGLSSRTFLALNATSNSNWAVKVLRKQRVKFGPWLVREADLLASLHHRSIAQTYEVIEDQETVNFVTEYCPGGELFDRILSFRYVSENLAANFLRQIMSALAAGHSLGLVHGELKPENVLFENKSSVAGLKLTDFCSSKKLDPDASFGSVSITQVYYVAPEVFRGELTDKADVWSAGVILYVLLCGAPPFSGATEDEVRRKICRGVYTFQGELWARVSKGAKRLVKELLRKDPALRPSAKAVLEDAWVQERGNNTVQDNILPYMNLENLAAFQARQEVRKVTLSYIASQLLIEHEIEELRNVFQGLDRTGEERITVEELKEGLDTLGLSSAFNIEEIVSSCDAHGVLDYTEFLNDTCNWKKIDLKKKLVKAYRKFDVDQCGALTVAELKRFAGGHITEDMWRHAFGQAEFSQQGFIQVDEFKDFILDQSDDA